MADVTYEDCLTCAGEGIILAQHGTLSYECPDCSGRGYFTLHCGIEVDY